MRTPLETGRRLNADPLHNRLARERLIALQHLNERADSGPGKPRNAQLGQRFQRVRVHEPAPSAPGKVFDLGHVPGDVVEPRAALLAGAGVRARFADRLHQQNPSGSAQISYVHLTGALDWESLDGADFAFEGGYTLHQTLKGIFDAVNEQSDLVQHADEGTPDNPQADSEASGPSVYTSHDRFPD